MIPFLPIPADRQTDTTSTGSATWSVYIDSLLSFSSQIWNKAGCCSSVLLLCSFSDSIRRTLSQLGHRLVPDRTTSPNGLLRSPLVEKNTVAICWARLSLSLFVPQSLLCAGTYRPRRWASIWIHELSLKSCAADGRPSIWYRDTVVSTARLQRALILQLTLQLISGALATTPVAVNGHAPILDALLFPKWFILFLETLTCQYSQAAIAPII
jgi:hypothetical protein